MGRRITSQEILHTLYNKCMVDENGYALFEWEDIPDDGESETGYQITYERFEKFMMSNLISTKRIIKDKWDVLVYEGIFKLSPSGKAAVIYLAKMKQTVPAFKAKVHTKPPNIVPLTEFCVNTHTQTHNPLYIRMGK